MSNVRFPQCWICLMVTLVQQIYANLSFEKWPGAPWAPGLAFVARENLQVVFDECEIHRFAADRCRRLPRQWQKVGECWNQFKVGSDIHLHRRHLLSLFQTYLVTSRQKTCQELPGVKSMKKEED